MDASTKTFEKITWILLVIVYKHASVCVGSRACFFRFLKIELTSLEKYVIEETGGIPGRARGRFENRPPGNGKFSRFAARQQLWCECGTVVKRHNKFWSSSLGWVMSRIFRINRTTTHNLMFGVFSRRVRYRSFKQAVHGFVSAVVGVKETTASVFKT